jgi:ElaB/YqjD/DUF883 family membrane-anchored ribosome-binding protein
MRTEGTLDDAVEPSYTTDTTDVSASDADIDTESQDTDEIRDEIEETRANMSQTIDAIQEKLSPERITEQAKDAVREATVGRVEQIVDNASETVRDTGSSFVDLIKQNPIPAAMAAVGIGWLWRSRNTASVHQVKHIGPTYTPYSDRQTYGFAGQPRGGSYGGYRGHSGTYYYGGRQGTPYYAGQGPDDEQSRLGQATDQAGEKASQAKEQVGEFAGQAKDQVTEFAGQMSDQFGEYADQAQYQARRAQYQFQDMFRDNPLAIGLAAFGLGAAVGLAVPETRKEDEFFGDAREGVIDRAQEMAQDTMEKVQNVMSDVSETAQQSAQDEGLSTSS